MQDNRKFHPPRALRNQITRTRLIERIIGNQEAPLTVLIAPAGYGKSTLIRQAAEHFTETGNKLAWLNCDASDREAENFITSIRSALLICDDAFRDCRPTLTAITEALNNHSENFNIVIDDYERVIGSDADSIIDVFAALIPDRHRILVGARKFDEARIAKLLLEGIAQVIDATALSFDANETDQLLNETCDQETIKRVLDISQGWPMMVQLTRIKADQPEGNLRLMESLLRPHSELFGFLATEVVSTLPKDQVDLLTACSIVDYIDAGIAQALTDNDKAETLLAAAAILDPLISTHTESIFTLKMHPVLRGYFSQTLSRRGAKGVAELHSRAARHYVESGDIFHAIEHALNADNAQLAAEIFEKIGGPLAILSHGPANVWSYLSQMPRPVIDQRASLSAARLIKHVTYGDGFLAQQEKANLYSLLDQQNSGNLFSAAELSQIVEYCANLILDACEPINRYLETEAPRLEVLMRRKSQEDPRALALFLALKFFLEARYGSIDVAKQVVTEYEQVCNDNFYAPQLPSISPHYGMLAFAGADFQSAARYFSENLTHHWDGFVGREELLVKVGNSLLAKMFYEQDQIEDALANIQAIGEFNEANFSEIIEATDITVARCYARRGDAQRALDHLDKSRARRTLYGLMTIVPAIDATKVGILAQCGKHEEARHYYNDTELSARWDNERNNVYWNWIFTESYLRGASALFMADGDFTRALELSELIRIKSRETSRSLMVALCDIVAAAALTGAGDAEKAEARLTDALAIHRPCNVIRPYFDIAPNSFPLLEKLRELEDNADAKAFNQRILDLWNANLKSTSLKEILTPRESDVLAELVKGQPTKLIARRLGVSPETIKHHLKNIFFKLGVENRKDAVSEAYRRAL